ncbi:hypothetical protein JL721_4852 [Aureococcus anophagefferens]|nr:hypothetical protein JL721_4852 [Aureococcus anophagefferens]
MGLDQRQQLFLQALTQRKVMTEDEAGKVIDEIATDVLPGRGQSLRMALADINKELKKMDLEVRGYYTGKKVKDDQGDAHDEKVLALINLVSDDVAKVEGGRLTPDEVKLFTKMLARIAAGEDHEVPIDVLRDDKGKLTNPQFAEFAKSLVDARWLAKAPDDDVVSYGPRSYLELADIIREHGVEVPQMISH